MKEEQEYEKAILILRLLSQFYIKCNRFINLNCDLSFYDINFDDSIKIEKSLATIEGYWVSFYYYKNDIPHHIILVIDIEKDIITIRNIGYQIQSLSEIEEIDSIQFILEYGRIPDYFMNITNKENFIKLLEDKLNEC